MTTTTISTSRELRTRLGLSIANWAKALNVSEATIKRWDSGSEPQGLHAEVLRGITMALDEGADPVRVGKLVALGIGALLQYELLKRCAPVVTP